MPARPIAVPCTDDGKNEFDQLRGPPLPIDGQIVMNPGRLLFSLPKPYSVHAPTDGLTRLIDPVCMNNVAGPCAIPSVCMPCRKHMSSTCSAICGNSADTHLPDCPC